MDADTPRPTDTDLTLKVGEGSAETPGRATGGLVLPGRQVRLDPERRQPCGYIWRNPRDGTETAIAPDEVVTVYVGEWIPPLPRPARDLTADQFGRLFPYRCPLCDKPLMFAPKIHLAVDHSWRERALAALRSLSRRRRRA